MTKKQAYERLKQLLDYCPDTGILRWLKPRTGKAKAGRIAGYRHSSGYIYVMVDNKNCLAHRLVWLLAHGKWPEGEIDHINGIKDDNRIANLRLATRSENLANCQIRRNNTSGHKGVSWDKRRKNWHVHVGRKHIGRFAIKEDAIAAYAAAASELYGEYARC